MRENAIVESIINQLGGKQNIVTVTNCMTRLRITVKSEDSVNEKMLQTAEGVIAVLHDRACAYEIVVGPGKSRKYADVCREMGLSHQVPEADNWKVNKEAVRNARKKNKLRDGLKVIGDIFVPMIPGIIATGLCAGIASLVMQFVPDLANRPVWNGIHTFLSMIHQAFTVYITAWAGYRAAECFGATPILGGILGMTTSMEGINTLAEICGLYNVDTPLRSILRTGRGGVLAVICGVLFMSVVEKRIRKWMPQSLDIILTPLLTLIVCLIPHIFMAMPLFGYVSDGIVWIFNRACMSGSVAVRLITGFCAATLFLPLVAAGMHHGLVALYTVQLQELGFVTLYPALAMAGAGQVGAAIAIYIVAKKLKHKQMCNIIRSAVPAGLLGVGEPLIYGVTLPMGLPFLTAGLGAGFGGAFVMLFQVASTTWGPSGLVGVFVMTAGPIGVVQSMISYLAGLVISYVMAFIITGLVIKESDVANALGGIPAEADTSAGEDNGAATMAAVAVAATHKRVSHGEAIVIGGTESVSFRHVIADPVGIHARPAGELVKLISQFDCKVTVKNGEKTASGKSVVELMMLGAEKDSHLDILVEGKDAERAADALQTFLKKSL